MVDAEKREERMNERMNEKESSLAKKVVIYVVVVVVITEQTIMSSLSPFMQLVFFGGGRVALWN